jgi:hypothetical protein
VSTETGAHVGKYNRVGGDRLVGARPLGQGNLLSNNLI